VGTMGNTLGTLWELFGNNGEHFENVVGTLWELYRYKGEHCIDPF
jgi:hypothetical protein